MEHIAIVSKLFSNSKTLENDNPISTQIKPLGNMLIL